jgi:hypothetical protein
MELANELTVIDKSIDVFKNGSALLVNHQSRAAKALRVGTDILTQWDIAYSEPDGDSRREKLAAIDKRSNDFLANCGVAKKDMEESRKAITQLMDVIRGMFTEEENKLSVKAKDSKPALIQEKRNGYAKEVAIQKENDRKAAELKAAKAQEENMLRAFIRNAIAQNLLNYLANRKIAITESFNKITLDDIDTKSEALKKMSCVFDIAKATSAFQYTLPAAYVLDQAFNLVIMSEEKEAFDIASFSRDFEKSISDLKNSLTDRLPAKKEELLDQKRIADEAEAARVAEVERQRLAENKRQEQIANAKAADKKRLEKEAADAREAEVTRLQEMERNVAEQQRLAADQQKQREEEQQLQLQREDDEAKKKVQEEIDIKKSAEDALALFNQTAESAEMNDGPESKSGFEIKINHPAGIVELFQFWFTRESAKLSIDEMLKKTIAQMKAYAEKAATKENVKINSKHLTYSTSTKAINRKEKI